MFWLTMPACLLWEVSFYFIYMHFKAITIETFLTKKEKETAKLVGMLIFAGAQNFSEDGYEQHMQVNHLAPALLSLLLLPSLIRASRSRIINVNSVLSFINIIKSKNSLIISIYNTMHCFGFRLCRCIMLVLLIQMIWMLFLVNESFQAWEDILVANSLR